MFNHAVAGQPRPTHFSTDNDPLFRFHRWLANLRVLEIDEIKSIPYVPVSHPFIERLVGTVRREYLDRAFFWNEVSLKPPLGTSTIRSFYRHAKSPAPKAANPCFVGVFGRFFLPSGRKFE